MPCFTFTTPVQDSEAKRVSFCGQLLLDEHGNFARPDIEHNVKWIALSVYGGELPYILIKIAFVTELRATAGSDTVGILP